MVRGPGTVTPGSAGSGLLMWLNMAYSILPPQAKLGIVRKVKEWAIQREGEAVEEMRSWVETGPNDFAAHGATHDTTGREQR